LGLPFDMGDMFDAVTQLDHSVESRERCFFSTPNLNFLISCQHDDAFRRTVIRSDLVVPDGMPIVWIARLLGIPLRERVSGSGIFEILMARSDRLVSVYFFGGLDGVAKAACTKINTSSMGLRCVGFSSPGFGPIEEMSSDTNIDRINHSEADFLVVSLGARKGNLWIESNLSRLTVPIVSHLGAVVNFTAGSLIRAPLWVQKIGIEWLWRIKEEPKLWRRYFNDGRLFLWLLLTRILPYAWMLRRLASDAVLEKSSVNVDKSHQSVIVNLSGTWTSHNLDDVRCLLKEAASDSADIRFEMAEVIYVDSAFIGLLILVFGYQQEIGKQFSICSVSASVRRIFKMNCAEYLLAEGSG